MRHGTGWVKAWTGGWVALAALCLAGSSAAAGSGCPVLFPDLHCERRARPEGSVMPMSAPYVFEDPYITSGLNFVGIWHDFPGSSVFGNGQLGDLALQIRLALTERLAFIATKDGLAFLDSDNPILRDETGFFNMTLGFKYAVWSWEDGDRSAILTPSLRYEIPLGQHDVFQGRGDGLLIPAVSAGYADGPWHVIASLGGHAPVDDDKNSSNLFYALHVDHAFPLSWGTLTHVVPFLELTGIHWTGSGDGSFPVRTTGGPVTIGAAAPGFEGVDVANLGSAGVGGNDYVTMAWGLRLPTRRGVSFGASYERPLSNRRDLTEQRVTAMVTWEF